MSFDNDSGGGPTSGGLDGQGTAAGGGSAFGGDINGGNPEGGVSSGPSFDTAPFSAPAPTPDPPATVSSIDLGKGLSVIGGALSSAMAFSGGNPALGMAIAAGVIGTGLANVGALSALAGNAHSIMDTPGAFGVATSDFSVATGDGSSGLLYGADAASYAPYNYDPMGLPFVLADNGAGQGG